MSKALREVNALGKLSEIKQAKTRLNKTVDLAVNNIKKNKKSIVICSKNQSKTKINNSIRSSLKHSRYINKKDVEFNVINNASISSEKASFVDNYKKNQTIYFTASVNEFKKWSTWKIDGICHDSKKLFIIDNFGKKRVIDPKKIGTHLSVFQEKKQSFTTKDKVVFLKNDDLIGVKNGTTGQIMSIRNNGNVSVKTDQNERLTFNIIDKNNEKFYNFLDHGHAVTFHKSQGGTYNNVVIYHESKNKIAGNELYVGITRAKENIDIITSNYEKLKGQCKNFNSKSITTDLDIKDQNLQTHMKIHDNSMTI